MSELLNKEEEAYLNIGLKKVVKSSGLSNDKKATILGAAGAVISFAIPFANNASFSLKRDWPYLVMGIISAVGGYITNKPEASV